MSSDFYFKKWNKTITRLERIIHIDLDYQETKAHDKKRCNAAKRLSGVLGQYINIYNDAMDCLHQNLQVQKTKYIVELVKALVSRILELEHELRKTEVSDCHFFGEGLISNRLTSFDADIKDLPAKIERPEHLQAMIEEIVIKAKEERQKKNVIVEQEEIIFEVIEKAENWWDTDAEENDLEIVHNIEIVEKVSEETLKRQQMIALIQTHEKSRTVIQQLTQKKGRREMWIKELNGTLQPQAPYEIRERSARLIQQVCRAYFELKRKKIQECKKDEILGIKSCGQQNLQAQENAKKLKVFRASLTKKYKLDWKSQREEIKLDYMKRNADNIKEEYRDFIRDWFQIWFNEIQFFHDIPNNNIGGSSLILKDEIPSPNEWLEDYEAYLEEKKSNKNKSSAELKFAELEAKQEKMQLKKEELMKKKLEAELLKKIMKNPNMHPGYYYPSSKKTEHILQMIELYRKDWNDFDALDTLDVKEKSVREIDHDDICMEVKRELLPSVDEDMRIELKALKKSLKNDYVRNGMKMLEPKKQRSKLENRKHTVKETMSEHVAVRMAYLAEQGYLIDYPPTKLTDFLGDHNFAGEELRCRYVPAFPLNGETRNFWWHRCREVIHGFHKILLVGPKNSGKTKLVHALASVNDALLFELDTNKIDNELQTAVYLQELVRSVTSCAKAAQPAVIYIKHVQRLFYSKVPPDEAEIKFDLIKRFFIQKLFKSIHRNDKITIIGTCVDPWLAKSKPMLKKFPAVVLLPETSYSIVIQILKDWVISNHMIPSDFDVSSLAYVLQGYSYGFLKKALQDFLTPERIIRIAAHGLLPEEVYDYFIENEMETKNDSARYLKWYSEKTAWGMKEARHIEEQKEFQLLAERFAEKDKKKKPAGSSAVSSATILSSEH